MVIRFDSCHLGTGWTSYELLEVYNNVLGCPCQIRLAWEEEATYTDTSLIECIGTVALYDVYPVYTYRSMAVKTLPRYG